MEEMNKVKVTVAQEDIAAEIKHQETISKIISFLGDMTIVEAVSLLRNVEAVLARARVKQIAPAEKPDVLSVLLGAAKSY